MDSSIPKRRVVVTGIGVVTPCGNGIQDYWNNLLAGKSGIRRVTRFDFQSFPSEIGGEVTDFEPSDFMDRKEARRNDRFTHFGMAASKLAILDGNLNIEAVEKERFGVLIGSGIGGINTMQKQSFRLFNGEKISPFMIPSLISNMAGGVVAIEIGAKGPNFGIVSACATGSHAIGESLRIMQVGDADIMLAGGTEAAVTELGYAGFCAMKAMSTKSNHNPEGASRPFDKNRDGFVMGEGAGILLLETLEHAQSRGAQIYCELAGYAASCDAYHTTAPDPESQGLAVALKQSLTNAGIQPEEVSYINAHGTSTPYNDKFETLAIKKVFGEHAYKLPVSSTKSMTGHLLGAAGGIEAAVCAKALETNDVPPTINYEEPDPDCDLDYVPNEKRHLDNIQVALSSNLGFGGQNAVVVMKSLSEAKKRLSVKEMVKRFEGASKT